MSFNFMAAVTICSDFGAQKIKSDTVSTISPSISHEVMGPDIYIYNFLLKKYKGIESHSHFIIGSNMGAVEQLRLCRERIQREGKSQGTRPGG